MEAGTLKFKGNLDQYDGDAWTPLIAGMRYAADISESEGVKTYRISTWWRKEFDIVMGASHLTNGFSILHRREDGVIVRVMVHEVRDPGMWPREIDLTCREQEQN